MSDALALVPVEDEDTPEQVWRLRQQGLTPRQIAKRLMLNIHEVYSALDQVLPRLDAVYRRRVIAESLQILDELIVKHMNLSANPESASVVIRSLCERRFWIGVTGSTDPVQLTKDSRPEETSTSAWARAVKLAEKIELLTGKPTPPITDDDDQS